jgi:hypothetical protein
MGTIERKVKSRKFLKWGLALCFINFLLLTFSCAAQSDSGFVKKGILSAAGTFAFGTMPQNNSTNAYLTGDLEYYAEKKISFRGDIYYFLNSLTPNSILHKNDALYFGAFYHIPTHSHIDPLIGFQPGISYTQVLVGDPYGGYAGVYPDVATICPLASGVIGINYFAVKWFHIEVNVRYTIGEHLTADDETNISELSFNFGLGFNFDVLKKRN